ncbi:unnamed protein product [Rhizophagus irregularis]|nr:unnamed protein product [Rhizophagus irregularis]
MEDRGQSKREFKHPRSPRPQKKAKSDEKSTGKEAIEAAVSFSKFIPLISEIGNVFNEILDLVEAAEHNKRTCGILRDRVNVAELAAKNIEKTFVELCEEFDGYVKVLCFSIHLTTADELEQLRADQNDLADYLKEMVDGMNEMKSDANSMMLDVNDMRDDMNEIRDDMGKLHDWQNIIKFYGLTCEGNKWYLVTEWAEFELLRLFIVILEPRIY